MFSVFCLVVLALLCFNNRFVITLSNFMFNGACWHLLGVLDYVTISILLMLITCFGYALYYTGHYFSGDQSGVELKKIICLFVSVMATLVVTGDFLRTLVMWEYLGVVSYFLILFYRSYLRLRSSVVTLVSSRFGDVCLFVLIGVNAYTGSVSGIMCRILLYFIIFTKSAGFPFIRWLLEAMRAPTPVSSLVHSSTLVAAGVWFAMRYDIFSFFDKSLIFSVLLLFTIVVTGLCCFFFIDLKKIVALSTCKKIAWCLLYLLFGDVCLSLFQLVSHGVSKCLLFMLVGDVMRGTGGSQASNCVYRPRFYGNWGIFGLFSIVLGLSGAPFIGVFFTKHFLLGTFFNYSNLLLICIVLFCVFLSYFYSFRLCRVLAKCGSRVKRGVLFSFGSGVMVYAWLLVNYFLAGVLDETVRTNQRISVSLLVFQFVSCFRAWFYYRSTSFSGWARSLFGCDNLVEGNYRLFNNIRRYAGIFFFRWDNQMISLFNGCGIISFKSFRLKLLKMIMLSVLVILLTWVILV